MAAPPDMDTVTPTWAARAWWRWPIGLLVLAAVCAPLLLYLRPGFLVMLADMLWSCF